MLNRDAVGGLIVGLSLGILGGFFLGQRFRSYSQPAPVAQVPAPIPPQQSEAQSRIFAAAQATIQDPKDRQAWVALGHAYFDSHRPQQAVEAYAKALALDPNDPDVLTDQGIMYRDLKAFDKAIANWEKAQRLDPKHVQSLYNLGIVYAFDLGKPDKAKQAWTRVVEIAPGSPQATQAKSMLAQLK